MFKKTTSFILSLIFALTAFGISALFGGVIGAGAVYYDYYTLNPLPGWDAFTDADLAELYGPGASLAHVDAPAGAPERVTKATAFTITNPKPGGYMGYVNVGSFVFFNPESTDNIQWCAKNTPSSGTTITGGHDFSEDSGICLWIGKKDGVYTEDLKINIFTVPSKGTSYSGTDEAMIEAPMGFCFEATKRPDEDGYIYYDFKTDFSQVDWFWKQDDGKNYSIISDPTNGKRPLPYNIMTLISGLRIEFKGAELGDVFYIGDFCSYKDTRIHTDELVEAIDMFSAVDPEAYTEESYEETTEIYLRAYEMLIDEELQTKYTQRQVDTVARELIASIKALKPLFPSRAKDVALNGFGVWNDDDFETMLDGGISLDPAIIADEGIGPVEPTIEIVANGESTYSPPYYGWSCFSSTIDEDGEIVAVKNPFGADLSDTAGIRFWMKNSSDQVSPFMLLAVGKAGEARFITDDSSITRPMGLGESGYVYASWNSFYDEEGDADIYDYLDQLDFIEIQFDDYRQTSYFISDLHAYYWSAQNADLTEITRVLFETRAYIATLNPNDYTPLSWQKLQIAVGNAEVLIEAYGVTQDEVDAAVGEMEYRKNSLCRIGDNATLEELNYLYAMINSGNNYWRGNYTSLSFNALKVALIEAEAAIDSDIPSDRCRSLTSAIENAISSLVPITHGGIIENGFFSFEEYKSRDLSSASGDRTPNVEYSLAKRTAAPFLPEGYDQALKMQAVADMSSGEDDEHGVLQFKAMHREGGTHPAYIHPSNKDPLVGDLTGSDGVLVWVGVNDVNLVSNGKFRIGVSNCEVNPLFEMHAIDIPIPPNGGGWIYVPWNYFDHYDAWTNGEAIRLDSIYFYIFRFDGEVKQGLEVYITGLQAYKDTATTEHTQPVISNIADGDVIDVSEGALKPEWNAGNAILDGKFFTYGDSIDLNGEHTLKVINGNKQTEIAFTVTGGTSVAATPIVSGAVEGGEYTGAVTLTWDIGEGTLNGEAVESGVEVSEPGQYTLRVTNGDKLTVINFTINSAQIEYEQPVIEGAEEGGRYEDAVTLTWNVGEGVLNGEAAESGVVVSEIGEYTLAVTNGDKEASVSFSVVAHEHDWSEWEITKEATCTEAGEQTRTCSKCGETETEAIEALGHDYEAVVTEPTCTEGGYTTYTCSRCGDSYVANETDPLGHDWGEWVVTKEATANEEGEETRTCARCGEVETRAIPVIHGEQKPGDMDGDNTITVADALAALRIAAKLVEETPEAVAIGDVDGDGHVTVADALAILRVAAKLADESSLVRAPR